MYLEHFGLRELPFSLTPDTTFFFEYGHYREAVNTLLVALRSGEGFIKVTGEVGTGKTLLCRKLLNLLEGEFQTAYIPNPFLTPSALHLAVAEELGLDLPPSVGQHRIVKELNARLVQLTSEGQHVVLFGQPELDEKLAQPVARQLLQRITFSYRLAPIDFDGMVAYVNHRLLVAGSQGNVRFTRGALRLMHQASRGIPRLVNILAHKSLMACYGRGGRTIEPAHVRLAIKDTEDVKRPRFGPAARTAALLGGLIALAAVAYGGGLIAGVLP